MKRQKCSEDLGGALLVYHAIYLQQVMIHNHNNIAWARLSELWSTSLGSCLRSCFVFDKKNER
jgi:hypothetical protein